MPPGRVLVVGDVMRDIVVQPAGPIRPGTDQRATIRVLPGGSGANQAAWLAHCGVPVRFLACVGEPDRDAELARLRVLGIEPALVGTPQWPTGQLVALIGPDGDRSFLTDRGANDALRVAELPPDILDGVAHLHVSGYALVGSDTREAVRYLLAQARERGLTLSFDPGSAGFAEEVGAAAIQGWVGRVDVFAANEAEAEVLTGEADTERQLRGLAAWADLVLLKRGAAGAIARDLHGQQWAAEAPVVQVVDTIGAGDAFLAAFLAGWLAGEPVRASLAHAVVKGAEAVTHRGGLPI